MLAQARTQAASGNAAGAGATLERALHIEPTNPWLWHRLAVLRLQQRMWDQAVSMAQKSISLAAGNTRLLGGNWAVIAQARTGKGDAGGAAAAQRESDRYFQAAPLP
ncbi:MAG: tetratricopeptide repeat protein [Gammaproteobacteria bacterium]